MAEGPAGVSGAGGAGVSVRSRVASRKMLAVANTAASVHGRAVVVRWSCIVLGEVEEVLVGKGGAHPPLPFGFGALRYQKREGAV